MCRRRASRLDCTIYCVLKILRRPPRARWVFPSETGNVYRSFEERRKPKSLVRSRRQALLLPPRGLRARVRDQSLRRALAPCSALLQGALRPLHSPQLQSARTPPITESGASPRAPRLPASNHSIDLEFSWCLRVVETVSDEDGRWCS